MEAIKLDRRFFESTRGQIVTILRGSACTVDELATQLRGGAAAVGRNPVSIVVPCHRVVGTHGALTGYAGGLERKSALLKREASAA